jgi:hypothetical protein
MSSGSWLTLHNCEIYYLSAVNYDPVTTALIFIRVSIYPWPGEGGFQLICQPFYFIRVIINPAALPHNISRGHYLPGQWGEGVYCQIFETIYFIRVTTHYLPCSLSTQYHNISRVFYLPCKIYCLVWLASRPLFTLSILAFVMIELTYKRTAVQVFRFFTGKKLRAIFEPVGPLLTLDR